MSEGVGCSAASAKRGLNRPQEEEPGVQLRASGPRSHQGSLVTLRPQTWRGSQG